MMGEGINLAFYAWIIIKRIAVEVAKLWDIPF